MPFGNKNKLVLHSLLKINFPTISGLLSQNPKTNSSNPNLKKVLHIILPKCPPPQIIIFLFFAIAKKLSKFLLLVLSGMNVSFLRKSNPDLERPFRTPLVPIVPILGILVCGLMIVSLDLNTLQVAP